MAYFTKEFNKFFKELTKNNYKEWFHANKKRYEEHVKKPFYAFVADLIEAYKNEEDISLEVKNAVFRINRDIRFSKDKSPYKNHVGAVISKTGRKDMLYPGIYVNLEAGNLMIAGGCYQLDKVNLQKIREHIVRHPDKANKILKGKAFVAKFGGLHDGEKNKIMPKEFKETVKEIPLIANKQYFYECSYDDENILQRDDLVEFIMEHYQAGKEWNRFLIEAMNE